MNFPCMFKGKGVEFKADTSMDKERECNVADAGPSTFTNAIHFLMSRGCQGDFDTMLFTIRDEFFGSKGSTSISMNVGNIVKSEGWVGFE